MKDARTLILKDIEQTMLDSTEFNKEMLSRGQCKKILGFYEARKLDVLSILSNPFKHQFDNHKGKFVLELAIEQAKIEDQIWVEYGITFQFFIKACNSYGLLKSGTSDATEDDSSLSRNAQVIKNANPNFMAGSDPKDRATLMSLDRGLESKIKQKSKTQEELDIEKEVKAQKKREKAAEKRAKALMQN